MAIMSSPLPKLVHQGRRTRSSTLLRPGLTYGCRLAAITCGDCFVDDACFQFYQRRLLQRAASFRVRIHAYCLLADAVLLIATPLTPTSVDGLLRSLAECYGHYFALRFGRSRRVFSRQLDCTWLDSHAAVIDAQRFLERVGINNQRSINPGCYHWSSYNHYALLGRIFPLVLHEAWRSTLPVGSAGPAAYRHLLSKPLGAQRYFQLQRRLNASAADCRRQAGKTLIKTAAMTITPDS